ncbi:VF530 family DNA-binding protein [Shewanella gaetbuli]|uniref:VF530 family protein n=1 Tax=Shewanella gaetbuli TaxID=220752 RepID=A0A9X2CJD1_9GAMM|nr:VF530 family protein [Shewanella gaetbuli]MCL1144017.1 VF530 family protein [Shewanella gaetbuli]
MNQPNNPLHGIKLETIVTYLVDKYGWQELGERINIRCFKENPSVKSSLKFLRKTQWARDKVEYLYLKSNKLPLPIRKDTPSSDSNENRPQQTSETQSNANVNAHIWGK